MAASALALGGCTVAPANLQTATRVAQQSAGVARTACDTRFTLVNQSGVAIREFYFTPAATQGFGADRLGRRMVPPGESLDFVAGQPGRHDFRIVMADGFRTHRMGADVCAFSRLVMTQRTLSAQ